MHIVVRNIGQQIVAQTSVVITVLAVRDGAVLLGIKPAAGTRMQEDATPMPAHETAAARRPSGG